MATAKSMGPKKKADGTVEKVPSYLCPYCNKTKKETEFYVSSDPLVLTGRVTMCKECCEKIARNYNENYKQFGDCTQQSICACLERIDKPFIQKIWDASLSEVHDDSHAKMKTNMWSAYIKNVQMPQYRAMRWKDGDLFNGANERKTSFDEDILSNPDVLNEYKTNQRDVVRLIGYDPFQNYPAKEDLPVLYAQLISFIDDETKNDGMKMNAIIQIVQAFNQIQKINDAINELSSDVQKLNTNNGTIKQHADTISKLLSGANALAKDNGISVNHNNSKSKGQNTLTGKMKDLDLLGFRSAKINMYDIDYCKGMQQVAAISAKAQIDQIGFDENTMMEISNIRRELVDELQKARDKAEERTRVLLVENKDLKEFLREKGLIDEFGQVIDNG